MGGGGREHGRGKRELGLVCGMTGGGLFSFKTNKINKSTLSSKAD